MSDEIDHAASDTQDLDIRALITSRDFIIGISIAIVVLGSTIAMITLFTGEDMNASPGSVNSVGDSLGDRKLRDVQQRPGTDVKRACYITETRCPNPGGEKPRKCLGVDGRTADPAANTLDGTGYCCTFGCESQTPTYRQHCKSDETVCSVNKNRRVCTMDGKVLAPSSMMLSGIGCCAFDCFDPASLPERACFPQEVVCPGKSFCYNFSQEVTIPNATNKNGNVCCPETGRKVCVSL
jgi:hypothetical protein